jgi:hypothetical protein
VLDSRISCDGQERSDFRLIRGVDSTPCYVHRSKDMQISHFNDEEDRVLRTEPESIYPNCHFTQRIVYIGGKTRLQLLEELKAAGVELNEAAGTLLSNNIFSTSEIRHPIVTIELLVRNLGYAQGATIAEIKDKTTSLGLILPPIELGPHFRLQYLDQPEGFWGQPITKHRAPPGSLTIALAQLLMREDLPKGFYLRRIKGTLWLRGYRSSPEHIWDPDDHFVLGRP